MSATSRASQSARSRLFIFIAAIATVVGLATPLALAAPASAAPVDAVWAASGTGTVTTVSDGTASAAQMTYDATGTFTGSWTFTATAGSDGTVTVPWSWQGLHAWFQVTTHLEAFDSNGTRPLVNDGPQNCCTSPSNGFVYGGVETFTVSQGQTFGFRLSGSNHDLNNFLRGTFTLSTKPYLDATLGTDNRQWTGAETLDPGDPGKDGNLSEAGEARWYKFPVVPGQQAEVTMTGLNQDDDIALYGDIQSTFDQLTNASDLSQLAASAAQATPGAGSQIPDYPAAATDIPISNQTPKFAPRIYAPRIYAPRIYAPRIYAPRIYAPRIYAPDAYDPNLSGNAAFSDAFSAAQDQTLLAVSANVGTAEETVSAPTGNTAGYFYVRVQGHSDQTPSGGFHLHLTTTDKSGTECTGLSDMSDVPLGLDPGDNSDPSSITVTDSGRLGLETNSDDLTTFQSSMSGLAGATDGVTLDMTDSPRVQALWGQVQGDASCPYAVNLVASAIKDIVDEYRGPDTKYVVLAGGDDVIPFFRYPDVSGLGPEGLFEPPMAENTPAFASLNSDQVQSQDAYGTETTVTIGGATLPVPDLAVGRLVKTPDEIESTVSNYLELHDGTLPAPTSSLVTGYDFLADAADAVHTEFADGIGGSSNDTLIDHPGVVEGPHIDDWSADDLSQNLLGSHHDLVYLAGHFSANDTLAADFDTAFDAGELDPQGAHPDALKNTVVLSAGCHSGYNIVDDQSTAATNTFDWTERMAQQHAVLIGGTGYQYGDSDFLEYSERLYLDVAKRLHEGPTTGASPVAVGTALVQAKQDYLSGLSTVSGIDQKAMLEASLYGLPMTGFDAPNRTPIGSDVSQADPTDVPNSTPGHTFGLKTDDLGFTTDLDSHTKESGVDPDHNPDNLPATSTWLSGRDGVSVLPGAPAVPKQIENVTVPDLVLRGAGFRGADYTDTTGILPVTGAPAIEGSTPNTTFESDAFFPQRLITPNYFGTLGGSGRTSLILTPGQYRSDSGGALTDTQRAYSHMDVRLFYSGNDSQSFGQNQPSLAAAPSIGNVQGTVSGRVVTFSATVTGDPSAGVQQVWVTWTGGPDASGKGTWASVDLGQDPNDSTHWTGTLTLPDGQSSSAVRFLVQAANGVGAVGMDTADGDGYRVFTAGADHSVVHLHAHDITADSPLGITAGVDDQGVPVPGRDVRFTVERGGEQLYSYTATTDANGSVELGAPAGEPLPSGHLVVTAELLGAAGEVISTDTVDTVVDGATLALSPNGLTTRAGTAYPAGRPLTATLSDARGPVANVPVTFTLPTGSPGATFPGGATTATVTTDADGVAMAPQLTARTTVGTFLATASAEGAPDATEAMAAQYGFGPFAPPISNTGTTVRNSTANTPLQVTALLADGSRLSDSAAQALVTAHRVQIRWREAGSSGPWTADTGLPAYSTKQHAFTADLKAPRLGWQAGRTYTVTLRILPGQNDVTPPDEDPVNGSFDLGSTSFTIRLT